MDGQVTTRAPSGATCLMSHDHRAERPAPTLPASPTPILTVFEAVAGAFEGDDFGVVDDAVDHGRGDDLIAEDVSPRAKGRFEVRISEACS